VFAYRTNWNTAPNRLSETLERVRAEGQHVLDLSASNPTNCGFQYDCEAVLATLHNPEALIYEPQAKGLESAGRAVAAYYAARGETIAPEDVVLTASTSEAYSYIFRTICNPSDEVLIPAPSYPLFSFLADIQDVKLVRYPLIYDHGWQIDFHALQQAITPLTRAVIVVNPNNPTGHFASQQDVANLNEICRAHDMAIVADEVFLDFSLSDTKRTSLATNAGALTFTMSGLSKISGLPQMKLAWLVTSGPQNLKAQALARLELIADTYLSVSTPVQLAATAFLELRHSFQEQLLKRVGRNLAELDRQVASRSSCNRLQVEGGWYAVLRVPATRSDEDLAIELLERKQVYVHPGHFYDFPADGFLVLSLIAQEDEFAEGITRLLSMFD
jgi:alanine-synthesizing transaminase